MNVMGPKCFSWFTFICNAHSVIIESQRYIRTNNDIFTLNIVTNPFEKKNNNHCNENIHFETSCIVYSLTCDVSINCIYKTKEKSYIPTHKISLLSIRQLFFKSLVNVTKIKIWTEPITTDKGKVLP